MTRVAIVGAGMAGASCAAGLVAGGLEVTVFERGRTVGGRMASPRLHDRRVDLGAGYFTVTDDAFAPVVGRWREQGLVREWTDTFAVVGPDSRTTTSGPTRYATPDGLRSLVRDVMPETVDVRTEHLVETLADVPSDFDVVVLAMPDPQARRLAPAGTTWVDYEPVISLAAGWTRAQWEPFDGAFVNDDEDVAFVADDGARRGDGAAVLVVHSTAGRARRHLDDPPSAVAALLEGLRRTIHIDVTPEWTHPHRWTFAKPTGTHGDAAFGIDEAEGRPLGLCTDSWCLSGSPRIESAWLSGRALARELTARSTPHSAV